MNEQERKEIWTEAKRKSYRNRVTPGQRVTFMAMSPRMNPGTLYSGVVMSESNGGDRGIEMSILCDNTMMYHNVSTGLIVETEEA